jgi:hypothetical protein
MAKERISPWSEFSDAQRVSAQKYRELRRQIRATTKIVQQEAYEQWCAWDRAMETTTDKAEEVSQPSLTENEGQAIISLLSSDVDLGTYYEQHLELEKRFTEYLMQRTHRKRGSNKISEEDPLLARADLLSLLDKDLPLRKYYEQHLRLRRKIAVVRKHSERKPTLWRTQVLELIEQGSISHLVQTEHHRKSNA